MRIQYLLILKLSFINTLTEDFFVSVLCGVSYVRLCEIIFSRSVT